MDGATIDKWASERNWYTILWLRKHMHSNAQRFRKNNNARISYHDALRDWLYAVQADQTINLIIFAVWREYFERPAWPHSQETI